MITVDSITLCRDKQVIPRHGFVILDWSAAKCNVPDSLKATTGRKMLYLEPQVVALIIFLPGHFCPWNLFNKWKVM